MMIQSNEVSRVNFPSLVPFLRLEPEYPEETYIWEIEVEIDEASGKGDPIEGLIQKRQQIIDSWIRRIEKELTEAYSTDDKKKLERELDRAKQYKNENIVPQ